MQSLMLHILAFYFTEPFTLQSKKRIGKPRGMDETIHDGSKKSSIFKFTVIVH